MQKRIYFWVNIIAHTSPEKSTVFIITDEEVFCCLFSSHMFAKSGNFFSNSSKQLRLTWYLFSNFEHEIKIFSTNLRLRWKSELLKKKSYRAQKSQKLQNKTPSPAPRPSYLSNVLSKFFLNRSRERIITQYTCAIPVSTWRA